MQNLLLAARAMGLGASLITLPLWNQHRSRRLLGLPFNVQPVCMVPMGWPRGRYGPTTRRPVGDVVHLDRFGRQPWRADPAVAGAEPPPLGPVHLAVYTDATERGGAEAAMGDFLERFDDSFEVTVLGPHAPVVKWLASRRPGARYAVLPARSRTAATCAPCGRPDGPSAASGPTSSTSTSPACRRASGRSWRP